MHRKFRGYQVISLIFILPLLLMSGCATTPPRENLTTPDSIEPLNRTFYKFNDALDRAIMKPVAKSYATITPLVVRTGVTNFFDNLSYLDVVLNTLLQGKYYEFFSDVARFLTNSTLGIGGLFDVATGMGFIAHEEDFGQTLAVWGFKSGAYLYIPLIKGPDTVRDLPDMATSTLLNPLTYVSSVILWPVTALKVINTRANLLDDTNIRDEAALDPYAFTREAYLQRRQYLIYDGSPPNEGYDDIFQDLENDATLKIE